MPETIRMLNIGTGSAAAYATRLLGNDGADGESGLFFAVNLDKRGVYLHDETGRRALGQLIECARIVVHSPSVTEAQALEPVPPSYI